MGFITNKYNSTASWEEGLIVRTFSNVKMTSLLQADTISGLKNLSQEYLSSTCFIHCSTYKLPLEICTQCNLVKCKSKMSQFPVRFVSHKNGNINNCILSFRTNQGNSGQFKLPQERLWLRFSQESHVVTYRNLIIRVTESIYTTTISVASIQETIFPQKKK